MKLALLSLLVVSITLPIAVARRKDARAARRAALVGLAVFMIGYLVLLFVYPVFEGR